MRAIVVALAVLCAGCVGASVEPADLLPAPLPGEAPKFLPSVAATTECGSCFETSVAVDPSGRIYATGAGTSDIGVSEDGGRTFRSIPPPPLPEDAPEGRQGDVLLQVSPEGRLYYSALVVRTRPVFVLEGLQVAWSDDGGATWPVNGYQSIVRAPTGAPQLVVAPDRQWLGFAGNDTVYLAYNQIPTGIWVARSDDGGATWGPWVDAAPWPLRAGGIGQAGPPVVDSQGRVYMPVTAPAAGTVRVFVSEDRGLTWRFSDAFGAPGRLASWFPVAAVGPDDRVHVASYYDGQLVLATSSDAARTWSDARVWGEGIATSPWIVAESADRLAVAWYRATSASEREYVLARGPVEGEPEQELVVQESVPAGGRGANTDFAHFGHLPDGRAVLVWSEPEGQAMVAVEAAAVPDGS